MSVWLQKKCSKCSRLIFYLDTWSISPKHCVQCRLRTIDNLKACLEQFLSHETLLQGRVKALNERTAFAERQALRIKTVHVLEKFGNVPERLIEACAVDKDLSRLVFRVAKERRLETLAKRETKNILPARMAPFLQGGAPGLGKRS